MASLQFVSSQVFFFIYLFFNSNILTSTKHSLSVVVADGKSLPKNMVISLGLKGTVLTEACIRNWRHQTGPCWVPSWLRQVNWCLNSMSM